MKEKIFGYPRNIFFLGLTSLANDFSSEMILSIFPAFFTVVLKAGAASLGLVEGVADCFSNLFKIYSGYLSDRSQKRKPFVVWGYTLSVFTRPFYLLVASVGGVLGLRFADRVGKGLRDAPRDAIISLSTAPEELGKSFGYHRAMDTTGAILGPLVAYFILRYYPARFDLVFITAFAVGLLALLTLVFISDVAANGRVRPLGFIASWQNLPRQFKFFLLALFVLSVGSLPVAVLLLKTISIGLLIVSVPLFYLVYSIAYAGFSITAGKWSDRLGARRVLIIGYVVLLAGYWLFNAAGSALTLALSFLVLGLFPALTDGVGRALAAQLTVAELRGGAFGWFQATSGIGALVAGVGGGYLWQNYSPAAALAAASTMIVAGLVLFSLLVYQKRVS